MAKEFIKEASGFISGHADNWLISANSIGPNKVLSLSLVKYVVKHTQGVDSASTGGTENTMEIMATFSLTEELARELADLIPKVIDDYEMPNFSKKTEGQT